MKGTTRAVIILSVIALMLLAAILILPRVMKDGASDEQASLASAPPVVVTPLPTEPTIPPSPSPVCSSAPSAAVVIETLVPSLAPTAVPDDGRVVVAEGFYYIELTDEIIDRITGLSYPKNDADVKIGYDELRYVRLSHYDFDGNVAEGELIVNAQLAREVTEIFYELYKAKYPLTSVLLVDEFGEAADDDASMAANNTSAFNYRVVAGSRKLSLHSFGTAIDINPRINPYVKGDEVSPENGAEFVDRTKDFAGKIDENDLCYKLFTERGWAWGGDFKSSKDYQHFSKDLGYERET